MRLRIFGVFVLLICFALIGGSAWADGVVVQNASFENSNALSTCGAGCAINGGPIPDWSSTSGTVEVGSWQLGPGNVYFNLPLPNGNTIAFVLDGTLYQDVGVALTPDTTYTLSVFVGDRADEYLTGNYSIALLDPGTSEMCSLGGPDTSITPGTFAQETCSFTTSSSVSAGDLTIQLSGVGGEAQFDDVTVSTPEPNSIVLLLAGLMFVAFFGAYYRRKQGSPSIA